MEVTRTKVDDMRVRQLKAQQMLRGELDGKDLEEYVEERLLFTTLEDAQNWARKNASSRSASASPAARSR